MTTAASGQGKFDRSTDIPPNSRELYVQLSRTHSSAFDFVTYLSKEDDPQLRGLEDNFVEAAHLT